MILEANAVNLISLNKKWYETDSYKDVREIDILEDKKGEDPTRRIQKNDLMRLVTKGLNRNERLIIILYYYEELTMKEIGATLDLSESRVSQMHSSIVQRLQSQRTQARGVRLVARALFKGAEGRKRGRGPEGAQDPLNPLCKGENVFHASRSARWRARPSTQASLVLFTRLNFGLILAVQRRDHAPALVEPVSSLVEAIQWRTAGTLLLESS
jgi:hypothetical protein